MTEPASRSFAAPPWGHLAVVLGVAATSFGLLPATALAASEADAATTDAAAPDHPLIDNARAQTRDLSERLARNVDSWFGDRPFEDGGKVSQGLLSLGVFHRQDQGTDVDLRFTARFRLPNFEKSAYLFVGRDDPREAVRDTPESSARQRQVLLSRPEDRSFLGGLGGVLGDDFSFRVGVGARLRPFAQVRWDKPWVLAPGHVLGLRETLFWSRDERFGSTTALSYELDRHAPWAVRWQGAATITQETRNVEWSSTLGAYRDIGAQRLLSLELLFGGTGTQGTGVGMSDRGVLAKWQQPLYKDWLVGELAAGQFWLRPDAQSPRGQAWALGYSLRMRL